jgi:hypothetical protein
MKRPNHKAAGAAKTAVTMISMMMTATAGVAAQVAAQVVRAESRKP